MMRLLRAGNEAITADTELDDEARRRACARTYSRARTQTVRVQVGAAKRDEAAALAQLAALEIEKVCVWCKGDFGLT
jgi:hypothetical protein